MYGASASVYVAPRVRRNIPPPPNRGHAAVAAVVSVTVVAWR